MVSKTNQGTALITGASSGIGAIYADRLAKRGYDLILVARNRGRLDELAKRITAQTQRSVTVLTADLSRADDLAGIEDLLRKDEKITFLLNNAGAASVMPLLGSDADQMTTMINLNVTALTRLTLAALPGFAARKKGAIVNLASVVAIAPELLNGVYGATKAFVLAFSRSIQHELADKGVRVQAVLPGVTRTPLWELAGADLDKFPEDSVMNAEAMVDAALAGFDLGEFATIPSLPNAADWEASESARRTLLPNLSRSEPAGRYLKGSPTSIN